MKKITLSIAILALIAISNESFAQSTKSRAISKNINIEETNGVKTLTIKTTTDGKTTTEVFTGAEADTKIAALEKEKTGTTKTVVVNEDGNKQMKIEKRVIIKEEIEEEN
ncbi:MAG: hypothetical protein H6587_10440 [Flavobacteriales bacterium]|nr:hypothetical protein [Flavobacteriales bacterium]MCB9364978.1 hypothetical protein [Flavobacteriales bacterium]